MRNDMPCGSTIGPIISARVALPTVDVGAPQLSMHSIREMCGANSVKQAIDLFQVCVWFLAEYTVFSILTYNIN